MDISSKLDKAVWDAEFEVTEEALVHKRTVLFKGLVVVDEFEEGGGGGGADLPVGVLGDVLYHDGASWVAKQASTLGFATQQWVEAQSYATQTWVNNKGYLTGITKAQVLGVMSGSGSSSEYLAGNGAFYRVAYSELSGTPDLSVYATTSWVSNNYLRLTGGTMAGDIAMSRNSIHGINCLTIDGDKVYGSASSPSYRRLVFGGYYASNNHGYAQIVMPEISEYRGVGELQFLVRGMGGTVNNYPLTKYMSMGGITQDIQVNSIITFNDTARFRGQVVFDNY